MLWWTLGKNLVDYLDTPLQMLEYDSTDVRFFDEQTSKLMVRKYSVNGRSFSDIHEMDGKSPIKMIVCAADQDSQNESIKSWMAWRGYSIVCEPDVCHRYTFPPFCVFS